MTISQDGLTIKYSCKYFYENVISLKLWWSEWSLRVLALTKNYCQRIIKYYPQIYCTCFAEICRPNIFYQTANWYRGIKGATIRLIWCMKQNCMHLNHVTIPTSKIAVVNYHHLNMQSIESTTTLILQFHKQNIFI